MPLNGYCSLLLKCLKSTCEIVYLLVEILQLVREISSFSEVLCKRGVLKNFQNPQINLRSSHPEVFCQKMFLKILQNSLRIIFAGIYFLMTTSKTWTQTLDLEQEKLGP